MSSFYVIKGRDQGHRFDLADGVTLIGRDAANDVRLQDTEVSRRHAEVRVADGSPSLVDLGSSNGTFVNGDPIDERELQSGDRVRIGRTVMLFTRSEHSTRQDASELVNIVDSLGTAESQIVQTIGQEESSRIFSAPDAAESPWLARARSNLQVMYRTSLAVSHTMDIDELLNRIMELIFEWVEADRGCIMLLDEESESLTPRATRSRDGSDASDTIKISRSIIDYVMSNEEGVLTSDAQEDQRWDSTASLLKLGVREAICVPLQGRYGIVGLIYIDTYTTPAQYARQEQSKFRDEHLKLMVAIGHQAALAVEDTSYYSGMLQAERLAAIGQTVATISHHVKNILQGIRGGSFLIEEGLKDQDFDVVKQGWRIVDRNQERISNLVLDMLSLSKERTPEPVEGAINETVADVVELMKPLADEGHVRLAWNPGQEIPRFGFDPEAIHRAVLNVIGNAIDACAGQDESSEAAIDVTTGVDRETSTAWIRIADNGPGIPAEDQDQIFKIFESRKGSRGTGLGLPVSRKILREHGGDIELTSESGRGSEFCLRLPLRKEQARPATEGPVTQTRELQSDM